MKSDYLKSQFLHVLETLDQELLPEDETIASKFLDMDHHVTPEQILESLKPVHPELEPSHIRRTMRMLCDLGIAQQLRLDGRTVYEHLHLDHHHDHLVCVRCGKIIEFVSPEIERKQLETTQQHGFTPLLHKLEIRGVCKDCANQTPPTRSLTSCLSGEEVEIAEILGGRELKRRLTELGLTRGSRVKILRSEGPVTLDIRGSRTAIGRGEAAKIITRIPQD